jgi:hypothetical protein
MDTGVALRYMNVRILQSVETIVLGNVQVILDERAGVRTVGRNIPDGTLLVVVRELVEHEYVWTDLLNNSRSGRGLLVVR